LLSRVKIIPPVAIKWKCFAIAGIKHEVRGRRHREEDGIISVLAARHEIKNILCSA
jgi:hypothetical protein